MIVDTNALSAAADDDPAVIAILTRARQMAIPVIVIGEYRYAIAQSRHCAAYENWLAGLLRDCAVLDINEPTTQHYAQITLDQGTKVSQFPPTTSGSQPSAASTRSRC